MPYVTTVERIGIEKGIEQGVKSGQRQLLVRLIQTRFGAEAAAEGGELLERVHETAALGCAGDWVVECETGDELLRRLRALVGSGQ